MLELVLVRSHNYAMRQVEYGDGQDDSDGRMTWVDNLGSSTGKVTALENCPKVACKDVQDTFQVIRC